ncbi:MAG: SusC/RagA family TonB-linked outer membrane protein [Chitinophagaceae bacterium]
MKLTAIILFIACLQVSAKGYCQKLVTLNEKNATLATVLEKIKNQTRMVVWYRSDLLDRAKPVTIQVQNETLQNVLDAVFKDQPLTYKIVDNAVFITPRDRVNRIEKEESHSTIDITGRIVNEKGEPVPVATISVQGTEITTITNGNGEFSIMNVNPESVLVITCIGYEGEMINLNGRQRITTILKIKVNTLDEMQVIAYGKTTKRLNTGNVSTLKAVDIAKQPVNNPLLAMQGRIPGMIISQSTGLPGTGVSIQIRGRNSITKGNSPLFIIDGVPFTSEKLNSVSSSVLGYSNETVGNPFSYINPADIESIDVLKDADATAIYGSRGANGVILITTKQGKPGKMRMDINLQSGFGKVAKKMKMLNTRQYLDMRYEAFKNDGTAPNPNVDFDLTLWDTTQNRDWQKELIGGTSRYNDMQASISGGNENTKYRIASGYHKETLVFPGDFGDQKGSFHLNINNSSLNKRFKLSLSALYTADNNKLSGVDFTEQAVLLAPVAPAMFNEDGSINWAPNSSGGSTWPDRNPAAFQFLTYQTKTNNLVGNTVISYELFPGLEIKSSIGFTNTQTDDAEVFPLILHDPSTWSVTQRRSQVAHTSIQSWIIEPQLTYTLPAGPGQLSLLAGSTILQTRSNGETLEGVGFNSDLQLTDIRSASSVNVLYSIHSVYKYNAVFGRINYNVHDKYLLNITARRDGTSRFGPSNRFHNFGAVAFGWVLSKEKLIQKSLPILSFGKLRASVGTTGSDQVGDYSYLDLYNPITSVVPYQGATGTRPERIFTPDLAWEKTHKFETGMELGFLKDILFVSASFYLNRSSNQLMSYLLPSITGFTSVTKNLDALVQNSGWEFEIRTTNINNKSLRWNSSFNFTINHNKLLSIANGVSDYWKAKVGHPLNSIFVYKYLGVDLITGLYKVADAHGNPTTNPDAINDATVLLDQSPKFFGGLQNEISFKGFELDFLLQFIKKPNGLLYEYNFIPGFFNGFFGSNQPVGVLNRWQNPGDVKDIQRFSQNTTTLSSRQNALGSNRAYGDVSYIRLKNVSLSWRLPDGWKRKMHLQNAKIYLQGQNLFTLTPYKGLDPETLGYLRLPPLRIITAGIQVTL